MPRQLDSDSLFIGWDFSTGGVKCLVFNMSGQVVEDVRFPNDLWTADGVSELNVFQLEGHATATVRALWYRLEMERRRHCIAGSISATHHTSSRVDKEKNPLRRAICWNDQTLAKYHAEGLARLGGMERVKELIGGPWAERYSLSHLVKDERELPKASWDKTKWIVSHGTMAAGYMTDEFGLTSISSAASTGLMDLRTNQWRPEMLGAIADPELRTLARAALPEIMPSCGSHGPLDTTPDFRPEIFATLDDQAAGLVGGGATDPGHVAVILGNSAVVNSSADFIPEKTNLDVMKLNWGPYLWMRCYSNGAQFLDQVVGAKPDWRTLESEARKVPPGCDGVSVLPFVLSEPSIGVKKPRFEWRPQEPASMGVKVRASFEALSYLIAMAVKEHEAAGQKVSRISVSGGIARSDLMLEILASTLNQPLERLESDEGPALGAAVNALWGIQNKLGKTPYSIADAVKQLVRFREPVLPKPDWVPMYQKGLAAFAARI